MADETAVFYTAPSSLVDHCRDMGMQRDPTTFGSSVPGGIWSSPAAQQPATHSRTSSADKKENEAHGVPIFRVDHKMNGEGTIFTPAQDAPFSTGRTAVVPQPVAEADQGSPTCSQSLADFCKALGEKHDPTQFGTSVPGGCWGGGGSADTKTPFDGEKDAGIPIQRVDHKMNADGFIFTPSKMSSSTMRAMVAGSLGSNFESEDGSWRGSPVNLDLFANSPGGQQQPLNLFGNQRSPHVQAPSTPPPEGAALAQILSTLPSVKEATSEENVTPPVSPPHQDAEDCEVPEQEIGEPVFRDISAEDGDLDEPMFHMDGAPTEAEWPAQPAPTETASRPAPETSKRRLILEHETCDVNPKCIIS